MTHSDNQREYLQQYIYNENKVFLLIVVRRMINNMQVSNDPNYVEFVRMYGMVRYFSPNPYKKDRSESDWVKVCVLLVNRMVTQSMDYVFKPLSPSLSYSSVLVPLNTDALHSERNVCYYNYYGSGELNVSFLAKYIPYYKELVPVMKYSGLETMLIVGRNYSYKISDGKFLNGIRWYAGISARYGEQTLLCRCRALFPYSGTFGNICSYILNK